MWIRPLIQTQGGGPQRLQIKNLKNIVNESRKYSLDQEKNK
jgi:hypothetical protein